MRFGAADVETAGVEVDGLTLLPLATLPLREGAEPSLVGLARLLVGQI